MRMYKYTKEVPEYNCTSPVYMYGREAPDSEDELQFARPHTRDEDEGELRSSLPRVISVLRTLKHRKTPLKATRGPVFNPSYIRACPFADAATKKQAEFFEYFSNFADPTSYNMRFIVTDLQKLLHAPKLFMIGFFSKMGNASDGVIKRVDDLDARLVSALSSFSCIFGYVTMRRDNGEYYNYVFLEDEKAVYKWRCFAMHDAAVTISPIYYDWVRINHAVLPCSLNSIMDVPGGEKRLEIVCTKYFKYRDSKCVWRGLRKYKCDEVFRSVAEHQPVSPFVFASFGDDEEYNTHKRIVEYLEKATGLPMKMIDIATLEPKDGADEGPSDFASIQKYNIDFAFTNRETHMSSFPNLNALAVPVYNSTHEDLGNMVDDAARANEQPYEMVVASVWVSTQVQRRVRDALTSMHKHKQHLLEESAYEKYIHASDDLL